MPKSKKKKTSPHVPDPGVSNGHQASATLMLPEEEDDTASVVSSMDGSTISDFGEPGHSGMIDDTSSDDQSEVIRMEDVLLENIDMLTDKSSKNRLSALSYIDKTVCQKMVSDFLTGRVLGIMEVINKGIKKASGAERCQTARMAMLLSVQLGTEFDLASTKPVLTAAMNDATIPIMERSMCLNALGFCIFMSSVDSLEIVKVMEGFEALYSDRRLNPSMAQAAINSWSLLLTIAPPMLIRQLVERQFSILQTLLGSDSTAIKIASGQAISLLFELARENDLDVDSECSEVADALQDMAADSNRYKGRKDRSQQRSCFRDFVQTIEDGSVPEKQIKIGSETLRLDSWSRIIQYGAFRELLGNGLHSHLQSNELVREVFGMGPIPVVKTDRYMDKMEKKYFNAMCSKMRTQARGKQRDKRSDFV